LRHWFDPSIRQTRTPVQALDATQLEAVRKRLSEDFDGDRGVAKMLKLNLNLPFSAASFAPLLLPALLFRLSEERFIRDGQN
jgi:hypothetical protein